MRTVTRIKPADVQAQVKRRVERLIDHRIDFGLTYTVFEVPLTEALDAETMQELRQLAAGFRGQDPIKEVMIRRGPNVEGRGPSMIVIVRFNRLAS